ncbi:MAG: hypothetical protein AAF288_03150 [Planctomycetota bacterium]
MTSRLRSAGAGLRGAAGYWSAAGFPAMSRPAYRRELGVSLSFPVARSVFEGGVAGVLAEYVFGVGSLGFAAISSAPVFANLTAGVWARAARGRPRGPMASALLCGFCGCVAATALLPASAWGGWAFVGLVVLGRSLLAGWAAVRTDLWRANYPRSLRAAAAARFDSLGTLLLAMGPLLVFPLLDYRAELFRVAYPAAAGVGLCGAWSVRRLRRRHGGRLLRLERAGLEVGGRSRGRGAGVWRVLRDDPAFRGYMVWQFFGGTANLMGNTAVMYHVVQVMRGADWAGTLAVVLNASAPMAVMLISMPWWARYLDRVHITTFRSRQGLVWVFTQSANGLAAGLGLGVWGLGVARLSQGFAFGGGGLAWQLGHHDFASAERAAAYMGAHQVLTGVRGLFAPALGVLLLAGWESRSMSVGGWGTTLPGYAGIGAWVFAITTALAAVACAGFWRMHLRHGGSAGADGDG